MLLQFSGENKAVREKAFTIPVSFHLPKFERGWKLQIIPHPPTLNIDEITDDSSSIPNRIKQKTEVDSHNFPAWN